MMDKSAKQLLAFRKDITNKYEFLGLTQTHWDYFFAPYLREIQNKQSLNIKNVKQQINDKIINYINKQIKEQKVRIFNNLLILLKKDYKNNLFWLKAFYNKLQELNLEITEEFYFILKKDSIILGKILKETNLYETNYKVLDQTINLNIFLFKIKPINISFIETKKIYFEYKKAVGDINYESLLVITKLKFLIANENNFIGIFNIYNSMFKPIALEYFRFIIYDISIDELKYLLNSYRNNKALDLDILKNNDYMYKLASIINRNYTYCNKKENKKMKDFYAYFLKVKNPLMDDDKRLIDGLFKKLSENRQKNINNYLNNNIKSSSKLGRKALNDINLLKKQFKRIIAFNSVLRNTKNRDIYTYFLCIKNPLTEKDKAEIDKLFEKLNELDRCVINKYINGEIKSRDINGKYALNKIHSLKRKFINYVENKKPRKTKFNSLYEFFLSIKKPLTEDDKKIIDELFAKLSLKRQNNILDYINGNIKIKDKLGIKATDDIYSLRRKFQNIILCGKFKPNKNADLYEFFLSIKNPLMEEDKKIIDELYNKMSLKQQTYINKYIYGIYPSTCKEGKKALQSIYTLKRQFKRYLEYNVNYNLIYELFKNENIVLTLENKKIINKLFRELPVENQENIINYLSGNNISLDKKNIILCDINNLKIEILKIIKSKINNPKKFNKFYEFFLSLKNPLTQEDLSIIESFFNELSVIRQENILRYVKGEINQKDILGKKATIDIQNLRRKFKNYINKNKVIEKQMLRRKLILLKKMMLINKYFWYLGYSDEEYKNYKIAKEIEIKNRGITALDEIMEVYVNESLAYIENLKKKRSMQ